MSSPSEMPPPPPVTSARPGEPAEPVPAADPVPVKSPPEAAPLAIVEPPATPASPNTPPTPPIPSTPPISPTPPTQPTPPTAPTAPTPASPAIFAGRRRVPGADTPSGQTISVMRVVVSVRSWREHWAWCMVEYSHRDHRILGEGYMRDFAGLESEGFLVALVQEIVSPVTEHEGWLLALDIRSHALGVIFKRILPDRLIADQHDTGLWMARSLAEQQCMARLDAETRPSRVVYTDGSHQKFSRNGAAAWVDGDGNFWLEAMEAGNPKVTEVVAISHAIRSTKPPITHLTVVSDSQDALALVEDVIHHNSPLPSNPATFGEMSRLRTFLQRNPSVQVDLTWVKGHGNDPMNIAADALAVLARRHHRAKIPSDQTEARAREIVDAALADVKDSPAG